MDGKSNTRIAWDLRVILRYVILLKEREGSSRQNTIETLRLFSLLLLL
jgi:hypothetical protein